MVQVQAHLSMCAILSGLQNHEDALRHAQKAKKMLQSRKVHGEQSDLDLLQIIAYYNAGIQLEIVQKYQSCIKNFERGLELAISRLGQHALLSKQLALMYKEGGKYYSNIKKLIYQKLEINIHRRLKCTVSDGMIWPPEIYRNS